MLAEPKKMGIYGIVGGIVLEGVGQGLASTSSIFSLLTLVGLGAFIYGCVQIAKAKGQEWYYGLLGLLSCIGLAVLWFVIEDKHKNG